MKEGRISVIISHLNVTNSSVMKDPKSYPINPSVILVTFMAFSLTLLLENCKKEIVPDPIPVLHFQNASLNCEVGSACTNSVASSIPNGGLISYSVDKLATINASTGAVTPTEAGAAVVTATQAASDSLADRFVFTV